MSRKEYSHVVKIVGTKYPELRRMIRNHPYVKIVGIGILKCLEDKSQPTDEERLAYLIDRGIELYHRLEEDIKATAVLEEKRRLLCEHLQPLLAAA